MYNILKQQHIVCTDDVLRSLASTLQQHNIFSIDASDFVRTFGHKEIYMFERTYTKDDVQNIQLFSKELNSLLTNTHICDSFLYFEMKNLPLDNVNVTNLINYYQESMASAENPPLIKVDVIKNRVVRFILFYTL